MIFYRVFGLALRAYCELPGLDQGPETQNIDYSLQLNSDPSRFDLLRTEPPCYVSSWHLKSGAAAVELRKTEDSRRFLFRFYDGVEFCIDRDNAQIWIDGWRATSLQAATHHLLFSLPGFLLCLRKSACLHGATIGLGNDAVALIGGSGFGKSMLCAQLAVPGIDILSDDLVALDVIDGAVAVHPGYPWICLRSDSLHLLQKDEFDASHISSSWDYMDGSYVTLDIRHHGFSPSSRRLQAIYVLTPDESADCKPVIERRPQHEAVIALMGAAERTRIPYPELDAHQFSLIGAVTATVPVFGLRYRVSVDGLRDLAGFLSQSLAPRLKLSQKAQA